MEFVPDKPAFTPDKKGDEAKPAKKEWTPPRTALDVMVNPQGGLETALSIPMQAATLGGVGTLAKAAGIPAAIGRVAGAAGIGAAGAAEKGTSIGWGAFLDALAAGLTETATKGLVKTPKVGLEALGAAQRGFEWASKAPKEVLHGLMSRLPQGKWVNVPSLSNAKLTVQEAVEKLAKTTGLKYQQARDEVAHELSRLDIQRVTGPKPLAGKVFKQGTSPERFEPGMLSKAAEKGRKAISKDETQAALDALGMHEEKGVPLSVIGAAGVPEGFASFARHALPHVLVP